MRLNPVISVVVGVLTLMVSCSRDDIRVDSKPGGSSANHNAASARKEIIAQNVLAVQLAAHHEFEGGTTFSATEPIASSLYLTSSSHVEHRRISAYLVLDDAVVEEQNIEVEANEELQEFDFRFIRVPRPPGDYQIRFVEIARSNGKPVLLARLFLNVE